MGKHRSPLSSYTTWSVKLMAHQPSLVLLLFYYYLGAFGCFGSPLDCVDELVWKKLYYVEDTQSISVQICCNVTGVWAARLVPDWEMIMPPAIDDAGVDQLSLPGFEMLLSRCHNETRIGLLANRKDCVTEKGKILHLEANDLLQFDQWYVMCFRVTTTATLSHSCPTICSVEKLCTNAKRCRNVWIDREIVNATENSISVLVQVGRLPFAAMLKTTVAEVVAGNRSDSKTYVVDTLPRNGQLVTEIDGLHPNCWYRIQTCVHIPTPYMFTAANVRLPRESVFCLEDEAVRTSKIEYSWNRKSLARSVNPPLLLFFFTALLLTSCIQLL